MPSVELEDVIYCTLHLQKQSFSETAILLLSARSNASFAAFLWSEAVKRLSDVCCGGSFAMFALDCYHLLFLSFYTYPGLTCYSIFCCCLYRFSTLNCSSDSLQTPKRIKFITYHIFNCPFLTSKLPHNLSRPYLMKIVFFLIIFLMIEDIRLQIAFLSIFSNCCKLGADRKCRAYLRPGNSADHNSKVIF